MAPNLIGSTFILAETAIAAGDAAAKSKAAASGLLTPPNNGPLVALPKSSPKPQQRKPLKPAAVSSVKQTTTATATATTTTTMKTTTTTTAVATVAAAQEQEQQQPYKMRLAWRNVILFALLHSAALYGAYLLIFEFKPFDFLMTFFLLHLGGLGITGGVHRLWSHKSYKAKLPLRIFLMFCQSLAFQNSIFEWCRDHRVHHKFTDTNADPHNSRRGFFFSHMGWLMCRKHPDVKEKGKQIDMSDLEADPVVRFQRKYFFVLMPICAFILPGLIPYLFMGVSGSHAFYIYVALRYTFSLHGTWLVNSWAHFYGMHPYEKSISAANTKFVAILALGEGWHNYHHVFPWDYKAAELSSYRFNTTSAFIDLMAYLGQAYDLKTVPAELVLKRLRRTGDGSHIAALKDNNNNVRITNELIAQLDHEKENNTIWGWDDTEMSADDRSGANIYAKKDD